MIPADWSDDDSTDDASFVTGASSRDSSPELPSPQPLRTREEWQTVQPQATRQPVQPSVSSSSLPEDAGLIDTKEGRAAASQEDAGQPLHLGPNEQFKLNGRVASRLYSHQREGVKWLWSLYNMKQGGILGDDMGLGKTMQCAAFLAGMLQSNLIR